jgi:hypothetical protein
MTKRAQQIWEAFKGELIVEPTDDMREALSTAIREIANEFQYYQCCEEAGVEDMVVDARLLYELADELENLK